MEGPMSEQRFGRFAVLGRYFRTWYVPAAFVLVMLIALAVWIMPRRVERLESADGQLKWDAGKDGQRVLWGPPRLIEGLMPDGEGNFNTPHLTDGGGTLYFSFKPRGGHAG